MNKNEVKNYPMPHGFYNMDCMEAMRNFPDKFFDLAVVDPPYGGGGTSSSQFCNVERERERERERGLSGGTADFELRKRSRFGGRFDRYFEDTGRRSQQNSANGNHGNPDGRNMGDEIPPTKDGGADIRHWDFAPPKEYFDELARVSKNQIIWGGNYFDLPPTRCFLIWKKLTISEKFTMAMCEYAWTSFNDNAKLFECAPQGTANEQRFHPTQKPIALYSWILDRYAKPGMKILDTHAGSASSLVACQRAGLEYWGYEIDPTYYAQAKERLDKERAQVNMMELIGQQEERAEQMRFE